MIPTRDVFIGWLDEENINQSMVVSNLVKGAKLLGLHWQLPINPQPQLWVELGYIVQDIRVYPLVKCWKLKPCLFAQKKNLTIIHIVRHVLKLNEIVSIHLTCTRQNIRMLISNLYTLSTSFGQFCGVIGIEMGSRTTWNSILFLKNIA